MLRNGEIDIVTFTSSSTVGNLVELLVNIGVGDAVSTSTKKDKQPVAKVAESPTARLVVAGDEPPEFDDFLQRNYMEWTRKSKKVKKLLNRSLIACIGPITAETARDFGLRVDVEASEHTVEGLVGALVSELMEVTK